MQPEAVEVHLSEDVSRSKVEPVAPVVVQPTPSAIVVVSVQQTDVLAEQYVLAVE